MLKDRKGWLIGESDVITLYCQPIQRLCNLFLSLYTNQKPRIKSPKSGDFENKNYIGHSPDPFLSRPNAKEGKAVWLRKIRRDGQTDRQIDKQTAFQLYIVDR